MRVVDEQDQRAQARGVRAQPVERVQPRVARRRDLLGDRLLAEQRRGHPRHAREPRRALLPRRVRVGGRRQLPHDAERERALELGAASAAHEHPRALAVLARRREQPRLADPGLADHRDGAAAAVGRRVQRGSERDELALALHQARRDGCGDAGLPGVGDE